MSFVNIDPVDLDFPVLKKPIFFYENPEDAPQNMRDLLGWCNIYCFILRLREVCPRHKKLCTYTSVDILSIRQHVE